MNSLRKLRPRRPWRNALIAATCLCVVLFVAAQLWSAGFAEWAFALTFFYSWCLLAVLWSNDDHIEESNLLLAGIIDHNINQMHQRLKNLEQPGAVDRLEVDGELGKLA